VQETSDNGGAEILGYEIYIDEISETTPSYELLSASSLTLTRTIQYDPNPSDSTDDQTAWTTANSGTVWEALVKGTDYRIVTKAINQVGTSEASEELRIALGALPDQPSAPSKVEEDSSETTIMLQWTESDEVDDITIQGYSVYRDDGYNGDFTEVYEGMGNP